MSLLPFDGIDIIIVLSCRHKNPSSNPKLVVEKKMEISLGPKVTGFPFFPFFDLKKVDLFSKHWENTAGIVFEVLLYFGQKVIFY